MVHEMKLHESLFKKIKSGKKTVELRLYDDKRRKINIGDRILFTNQTSQEMIAVIVTELYRFESFRKLFEKIPSEKCGNTCDTSIDDLVEQMRKYYSAEAEQKYGVLGIEIELGDLRSVMMEKENRGEE